NADILREKIARAEGVNTENIFCGNGSDEVLALCFPAFFDKDGKGACFADITYSFYPVFAEFFSVPQKIVPLTEDYRFDLDEFSAVDCQGYLITNPNAPTGVGIAREEILNFVKKNPQKLVIVDEAYMDFYGQSVADCVNEYDNLLVVKTFSKSYSLAGIRCGYAVGNASLIDGLFRVKDCFNSYPLDRVCQAVCAAAVESKEYYAEATKKVVSERERVTHALRELEFFVPDSSANFVFAGNKKTGGKFIYEELKKRGVLVRYWNKPALRDFCRITIGTKEQNDALLSALKEILQ
ncbi:MAG: aminotransferase class I/II-fold pyridoxal phosphate-dependent enzyme, partial [Clostridia bacterium]|nr:aminotransferase class I/II-fold pyridoxal phosphate-dependent enzyme [Clostridia bacterium]